MHNKKIKQRTHLKKTQNIFSHAIIYLKFYYLFKSIYFQAVNCLLPFTDKRVSNGMQISMPPMKINRTYPHQLLQLS